MRKKVLDYLEKPTKKGLAELTTMEQKWVAKQLENKKPAAEKKPAVEKKLESKKG